MITVNESFQQLPPSSSKQVFDVDTELAPFSKIYISKESDPFRIIHCFELLKRDYQIFGELPDKSKKLLFTVREHFEWECCECDNWGIDCYCFAIICCDKILYQLDYKKNNQDFYTQGIYQKKGCYVCKCNCNCLFCCGCCCCCPQSAFYLRENTNHDDPDFDKGIKKGKTLASLCKCTDATANYVTQEGNNGYGVRATCPDVWKRKLLRYCCGLTNDFEIGIEDERGNKSGKILFYSGCCSELVKDKCCYLPKPFFEIFMPPNASSTQKFQIIADAIHFDVINNLL